MKKIYTSFDQSILSQSEKRERRNIKSKIKRKNRRIAAQQKKSRKIKDIVEDPLMSLFRRKLNGKVKKIELNGNVLFVTVPKKLSFIDCPQQTLSFFSTLVKSLSRYNFDIVRFNHYNNLQYDLGASLFFDLILMSFKKEAEQNHKIIKITGIYSKLKKINRLIKASGLTKHLDLKDSLEDSDYLNDIHCFPLYKGKKMEMQIEESSHQEKASSKISAYLNECFNQVGFELSKRGKTEVQKFLGEVIDNCEEHSEQNDWYAIAYQDLKENECGECFLVIMNFGRPISDTMQLGNVDSRLKTEIEEYCKNINQKSIEFDNRALTTLYSIQEGVSRFKYTERGKTRGTGTRKMINFFQNYCCANGQGKSTSMSITSGNTSILFDDKYSGTKIKETSGEYLQIWFNKDNKKEVKPDKRNVRVLKGYFPGTIASLRFYFDREYLKKSVS